MDSDLLKSCFQYDPLTGELWKIKRFNWKGELIPCKPTLMKCLDSYGYIQIHFGKVLYKAHRLIYHIVQGYPLPSEYDVDHQNGVRSDNRWVNLRFVKRSDNSRNVGLRSDNTSGYQGVHYNKISGKYEASIYHNGRKVHLGRFQNIDDAILAREKAVTDYGYHENHGQREGWRK